MNNEIFSFSFGFYLLLLFSILSVRFSFQIRCWDAYEIDPIDDLENSSCFLLFLMNYYEDVQCSFGLFFYFFFLVFIAKVISESNRALNRYAFIAFGNIFFEYCIEAFSWLEIALKSLTICSQINLTHTVFPLPFHFQCSMFHRNE